MSEGPKPIRSPAYPNMPLQAAVAAIAKIEGLYRSAAVDRLNAAKLIGYSALSGPAQKALADLASYGLLERAGKGEARVTERARDILHASGDRARTEKLKEAGLEPPLFREIRERFPGMATPPEDGVVTYLNRQGFNPTAVRPAAKAFLQTMSYLEEIGAFESDGADRPKGAASGSPPANGSKVVFGGAAVGDLVQWEADGALRLEAPARVRAVQSHEGREWVFVDGSETGIPMDQVIVDRVVGSSPVPAPPPTLPLETPKVAPATAVAMRKEVFALDEGDVTLNYPENLSAASFHDLQSYVALFLRKAQRRAMAGDYFIEFYAPDGVKAKSVTYFDTFSTMMAAIAEFKRTGSTDILRVHVPASSPSGERQELAAVGAQLI